jgi:F-type H+-transporting ATPase subunit a
MEITTYDPLSFNQFLLPIVIVTLFLAICCFVYYAKLRKCNYKKADHGYVQLVQIYFQFIRNLVVQTMGEKCVKLTPYFMFLFAYILCCNLVGIFGFNVPTSSLSVTLSFSLITFFGTLAVGFKYQKFSYLKKFCVNIKTKNNPRLSIFINPYNVLSNVTPIITLSFRLLGNMFAGSLIISLYFYATQLLMSNVPFVGVINILGGFSIAPFRMYFDIMTGLIQAYVFVLLSLIY